MEAAAQQSTAMQTQIFNERKVDASALHKLFTPGTKQQEICFRCGSRHNPSTCPFKEKNCFFCRNKGHTVRMCRKKSRLSNKSGSHEQHQVEADDVQYSTVLFLQKTNDVITESSRTVAGPTQRTLFLTVSGALLGQQTLPADLQLSTKDLCRNAWLVLRIAFSL